MKKLPHANENASDTENPQRLLDVDAIAKTTLELKKAEQRLRAVARVISDECSRALLDHRGAVELDPGFVRLVQMYLRARSDEDAAHAELDRLTA